MSKLKQIEQAARKTSQDWSFLDNMRDSLEAEISVKQPEQPTTSGLGLGDIIPSFIETQQYQTPRALGSTLQMAGQVGSRINPALLGGTVSPFMAVPQTSRALEEKQQYFEPETSPFQSLGEQLRQFADVREAELPKRESFGGKLGAGASSILTSAIPAVAATFALGPVGGTLAGFGSAAMLEGGLAYDEAVKYGLDEESATGVGLATGLINGALEFLPIGKALKTAGIGREISKEVTTEALKRGLVKNIAKNIGTQAFAEGSTEGLQELVSLTVESLYKKAEDSPELAEWLSRTGESALYGSILGGLTGGLGGGVQTARLPKDVKQTIPIDQESIAELPPYQPRLEGRKTAGELSGQIQGEPQYREQQLTEAEKQLSDKRSVLTEQIKQKRAEYKEAPTKKAKKKISQEIRDIRNQILEIEQPTPKEVNVEEVTPKVIEDLQRGKTNREVVNEYGIKVEDLRSIYNGNRQDIELGKFKNKVFELIDFKKGQTRSAKNKANNDIKKLVKKARSQGINAEFNPQMNHLLIDGERIRKPIEESTKVTTIDYEVTNPESKQRFEKLGIEEKDKTNVLADLFGEKKYLSPELNNFIPQGFGQEDINKGISDIKKAGGSELTREAQITRDYLKNIEKELENTGYVKLSNGQEVTQADFESELEQYYKQQTTEEEVTSDFGEQYGQENIERIPSSEQRGETTQQKQLKPERGGEKAETSGILEEAEEIKPIKIEVPKGTNAVKATFESGKTSLVPKSDIGALNVKDKITKIEYGNVEFNKKGGIKPETFSIIKQKELGEGEKFDFGEKGTFFQKKTLSQQPSEQVQKQINEINKFLPGDWNVKLENDETMPEDRGSINIPSTTIRINMDAADNTTIPHEIAHGALSIADKVRANRLLKNNGWDGNGDMTDTSNPTLVTAHEAIAEKYEKYHTDKEQFKRDTGKDYPIYKIVFEKMKQLFESVSNFLKGQGFTSEAKFYDDLYNGKFADNKNVNPFVYPEYELAQKKGEFKQTKKDINTRIQDAAKRKNKSVSQKIKQELPRIREKLGTDIITPIHTRLEKISKPLARNMRRYEFNTGKQIINRLREVEPFMREVRKIKQINEADYNQIDYFLKAGRSKELANLLRKYNLTAEYGKVRKVLDNMFGESKNVGFQLGYRYEYFPRRLNDSEGFVEKYKGTDAFDVFENLFNKIEKQRKDTPSWKREGKTRLTEEEKLKIMNNAIRGYYFGITLKGIANFKERLLNSFQPEHNEFYEDAIDSLVYYITEGTEAIESRKFFGKGDENLDESIAAYIDKTGLSPKEAKEVSDLFKARFNTMNDAELSKIKSLIYLTTLGSSPTSAIKQLADISTSVYKAGAVKTIKAFKDALTNKSEIKMADIGINDISAEFFDPSRRARFLNKVLNTTGFTQMDRIGKETVINATYNKYQKLAKKNDQKLKERLNRFVGENRANQTMKDFAEGKRTEATDFMVFNELLDVQPIALSEMPKKYLEMRGGKAFYSLKSFTLKRLDFIRNETTRKILGKNNSKAERLQGMKNLITLIPLLGLGEYSTDMLINALLGNDKDSDDVLTNALLQLYGFSKYDVDRFTGPSSIAQKILPVTTPLDYVYRDVRNLLSDKKMKWESLKLVPVVGKPLWYWFFKDKRGKKW